MLRHAGAVEDASEHVVATAISALARAGITKIPPVADFTSLSGLGARGVVDGQQVLVGSARLLAQHGTTIPTELDQQRIRWEDGGYTTVAAAADSVVEAVFALADTVKPTAAAAVTELHRLGPRTVLLTGDNEATTRAVAAQVGINEVIAEVLPHDKAAMIESLQAQGRSVAMVGDGVNDAPALARADLGLAVISGTDVALGAADLILMRTDLNVVPSAIKLARGTLRTSHGNLTWAFSYNIAVGPRRTRPPGMARAQPARLAPARTHHHPRPSTPLDRHAVRNVLATADVTAALLARRDLRALAVSMLLRSGGQASGVSKAAARRLMTARAIRSAGQAAVSHRTAAAQRPARCTNSARLPEWIRSSSGG